MKFRDFLRILAPHLLDAVFVLLLAVLVPVILLLFYWEQSILMLGKVLPLANQLKRIAEVILVVIPLATLYIATAFAFMHRIVRDGISMGGSIFSFFFFGPVVALLVAQPCLYYYMLSRKHEVLDAENLTAISFVMGAVVLCLFVLEAFMSVSIALAEIPLPPWPIRRDRAGD